MLPSGQPASGRVGGGERAPPELRGAQPGEQPSAEQKRAMADLHEPPEGLPKGVWRGTVAHHPLLLSLSKKSPKCVTPWPSLVVHLHAHAFTG